MSRHPRWPIAVIALAPTTLNAQPTTESTQGQSVDAESYEDCSQAERDAAAISGEIVVCRKRADDDRFRTLPSEDARRRYAEETMRRGDPSAPEFAKSCAKNPEDGVCMKFGSVPPPAYMIDFSTLPETPEGSDADKIAKGERPQ